MASVRFATRRPVSADYPPIIIPTTYFCLLQCKICVVSLGMLMTEVMPIPQHIFDGGEVSAIQDGQSGDGPPGKRDVNDGR
ncbi:hypothetical protein J6590_092346 [Homalodisca vitripennis]|nr:hypothetical protein J6590_092346 [Homalodisca vitripennis]